MPEFRVDEESLRKMFDILPDAVYWVRPVFAEKENTIIDFEITYSNKEADLHLPDLAGGLTGKRIMQDSIFDEFTRIQAVKHFKEVFTLGVKQEFNYYNATVGRSLDILRTKFEGGVLNILRDRTAQRKAELKEREQTEKLNSVIENSPNGIMVFTSVRDENGEIVDFKLTLWNNIAAELFRFTTEELAEITFDKLIALREDYPIHQEWKNFVETVLPFQEEYYSKKLGKYLSINVIKLGDGFMVTYTDVTAIRNYQHTIELSANRLNTIINSSHVGIFTLAPVTDLAGTIVDFRFGIVNPAVAAYIGQSAEVLRDELGSTWFPAYKENGLFEIYVDTFLHNKSHHFDFHYEDGYDIYFDILTIKVKDEILVTFTDQTVIKKLQLQLEASVEGLKRSNQSLEEFAYAASHDLQEPLRKINFFMDKLKISPGIQQNEETDKIFERIKSAIVRMKVLIEDLLTYSSVTFQKEVFAEVDLAEVVQQVLSDLETNIAERQAVIELDELPIVQGDKRQLSQLFSNLLSNAIKYCKEEVTPAISISYDLIDSASAGIDLLDTRKKYHLIQVRDNGIGFEQEHAQKIFQVFQRLHGKQEYPGTGVGLAIAHKVIANHSGWISAESKPGIGTVFKILLPLDNV